MVSLVHLQVDDPPARDYFTTYDTIKGKVTLEILSSLSLQEILVKLKGAAASEAQVTISVPRYSGSNSRKTVHDLHNVLYESRIVFPPPDVRKISTSEEFTLPEGIHTFPFEFKIPLFNSCLNECGGQSSQVFMDPNLCSQHKVCYLPPSLPRIPLRGLIDYYVKATCRRSSRVKANLRAIHSFNFLPLNMDSMQRVMDSSFWSNNPLKVNSKDFVIEKRLIAEPEEPTARRKGFFLKLFSSNDTEKKLLQLEFEVRFLEPAVLIPGHLPAFSLFLISWVDPATYTDAGESNGLGVIYMQKLKVLLWDSKNFFVPHDGGHASSSTKHISVLMNKRLPNIKLDLCRAVPQPDPPEVGGAKPIRKWELEIPRSVFEDCIVPPNLLPTIDICNIRSSHALEIEGRFTPDKMEEDTSLTKVTWNLTKAIVFSGRLGVLSLAGPSCFHEAPQSAACSEQRMPSRPAEKAAPEAL